MLRIAIIGAGFSGTLLTIHLIRNAENQPLKVYLIEKAGKENKGAAYSTNKEFHLLNVQAHNMSAFPDEPDHFVNWLSHRGIPLSVTEHMPRKVYREYLQDILNDTISAAPEGSFELIYSEAESMYYSSDGLTVRTKEGIIDVDKTILALGNFPSSPLPGIGIESLKQGYCPDPWAFSCADVVDKEGVILIIGSGLTMADTCVTLGFNNHKGKIFAISTHGFLPEVHKYTTTYTPFGEELLQKSTALELLQVVRKHLAIAKEKGIDWRCVVDSIRPFTQQIWMNLDLKERKIFLKHLHRRWSIARHRIPPEYESMVGRMIDSRQLTIIPGRISSIGGSEKIVVKYLSKKTNQMEEMLVDYVINCTGPEENYLKLKDSLIVNLLSQKLIEPGPLNMGINAEGNGSIINKHNNSDMYTIGPPLIGVLYETIAVPELRVQAKMLAEQILTKAKKVSVKA